MFLYLSEQPNVCVHACGREDWRAWLWPQCVGCSKDIYDNIALFLSGTCRDTLPYKHQCARTRAIASPWCFASKEPPPSLTAEAILLQQRDHYFKKHPCRRQLGPHMLTPGSAFYGSAARARKFSNYRCVLQYRVGGQCSLCEIKRKIWSWPGILKQRVL